MCNTRQISKRFRAFETTNDGEAKLQELKERATMSRERETGKQREEALEKEQEKDRSRQELSEQKRQ